MNIDVKLPDGRTSKIVAGGCIADIIRFTGDSQLIILTDENVYELYKKDFPQAKVIIMHGGEKNKTLSTVEKTVEKLIHHQADRNACIVGIGGGIVTDLTGFIASVYMRGVKFGFVSTTLLAQVDASVGGKNGVNCDGYKNMIGVFNQPDFVICASDMLQSLPDREFYAGMAEAVKTALIADKDLFNFICDNVNNIKSTEVINHIVANCVRIKAAVVSADEREKGERRKLNLGHTIGHAVEKIASDNYLHGEAVSIGMVYAAKISHNYGLLQKHDLNKIVTLLKALNLPIETDIPPLELFEAATKDKKRENQSVYFIMNNGIGNTEVHKLGFLELSALIN